MKMQQQLSCLVPVMDGVEHNAMYPDTFEIPSETDKARVRPGDFVKAGFATEEGDRPAERMWVCVCEVDAEVIRGTLANNPVLVNAKFGDPVEMGFHHILAIEEAPDLMQQARDWEKRDDEKQAAVQALDEYACDDKLIAQLYAQRDELLAALEHVLIASENNGSMNDIDWDEIRTAVAMVRGEA